MFSNRVMGIELSGIRKIFDMAQGEVINLGLGEPDFQPPPEALDAIREAVERGYNKYGPSKGFPELREAIAEKFSKYADITAENVLITVGATEGMLATMLSLIDPGDEVLYPDPGFVLYKPHTIIAGGKPVAYPILQENDFMPTQEDLQERITKKTKAIILNYPNNPTGGIIDEEHIKMVVDIAEDNDLIIISDEVYFNIIYEGAPRTFLGRYDKLIFVNSFSKEFAMTGWRLGYLIAPKEYVEQIGKIHYYSVACPQSPIEYAALTAIRKSKYYSDMMVEKFRRRRDLIYDLLRKMDGVKPNFPRGAFYIFPRIELNADPVEIVKEVVKRGVLCTPGNAFGKIGTQHIRFSYAASEEDIRRGMEIFDSVLEKFR
ncbi:aspartate/tyrosine/aromatic aminotransferase [Aciduliprofundum sp. MAR08-339]|uniref:pyridoxal phosphate-dependent aminotransferase n=1 Tax=Aciduliprofundum sp. (strain MAR08-339) TaxID=673860 RepID=UPI0002A4A356|nr:aspartate/tyrosine/aromatic aminotransferase [Aciduliprofundum sp. MAR08-339]